MTERKEEKAVGPDTFGRWLTSNKVLGRKLLSVAGVVGLVVTLHGLNMLPPFTQVTDLPRLINAWNDQLLASKGSGSALLHLFQAMICLLLVILTREPSEDELKRVQDTLPGTVSSVAKMSPLLRFKERIFPNLESIPLEGAYRAYVRIHVLLSVVFGMWFLYYFAVGVAQALHTGKAVASERYFFATTFDVWNSVALFWLYIELSNITVQPELEVSEGDEAHRSFLNARAHRWLSLLIGVAMTLGAFMLAFPGAQLVSIDFWHMFLSFMCSSLAGVSFALVVGCMSRRLLSPGPVFLALLYFYSMLQLTGVSFTDEHHPWMEVAATSLALPLKVLFWLVFMWSFQTGRMQRYVRETRALMGASPSQEAAPAVAVAQSPPADGRPE
jgi:hypothetical protein